MDIKLRQSGFLSRNINIYGISTTFHSFETKCELRKTKLPDVDGSLVLSRCSDG